MENKFFNRYFDLCREHGETPNSVAKAIGASSGSVTAWKQGAAPRNATLGRIADYFGVSTDYLLGKTDNRRETTVSDQDIKFALFGGGGDITDEMYEEVLAFAQYVKFREGRKKE